VDLAQATLRLIEQEAQGILHVTNSGITSWYEFAAATLQTFGVAADLAPVTTADWIRLRPKQARRPAFSGLDCSRYAALTGHVPRPWTEALSAYRESCGPLPC
jgi:dTDP-4-dehydrorhamnose reductase